MLFYLIILLIILMCCKKNNLELFDNLNKFQNNTNNCNNSKKITDSIICKKNQYCINDNCDIDEIINSCGSNNINYEAILLNSSKYDKDINNRRLLNHLYSTFELNSELNTKTWCD